MRRESKDDKKDFAYVALDRTNKIITIHLAASWVDYHENPFNLASRLKNAINVKTTSACKAAVG